MIAKLVAAVACLGLWIATSPMAYAQFAVAPRPDGSAITRVQLRMKPPKCGDHLEGSEAMPLSSIPLEFQILYEEDSGNECFRQGNNAQACDHYRRALVMLNQEYPYQADIRAIVQAIVARCR